MKIFSFIIKIVDLIVFDLKMIVNNVQTRIYDIELCIKNIEIYIFIREGRELLQ